MVNVSKKTACCYNCKFLDEKNFIKEFNLTKYNCSLKKSYKYKYSRCEDHEMSLIETPS